MEGQFSVVSLSRSGWLIVNAIRLAPWRYRVAVAKGSRLNDRYLDSRRVEYQCRHPWGIALWGYTRVARKGFSKDMSETSLFENRCDRSLIQLDREEILAVLFDRVHKPGRLRIAVFGGHGLRCFVDLLEVLGCVGNDLLCNRGGHSHLMSPL